MDRKAIIKSRFTRAIESLVKPRPLIGDKWFCWPTGGDPADFQFRGVRKLAKAAGRRPGKLAKELVKELDLYDLGGKVEVTDDLVINVRFAREA